MQLVANVSPKTAERMAAMDVNLILFHLKSTVMPIMSIKRLAT